MDPVQPSTPISPVPSQPPVATEPAIADPAALPTAVPTTPDVAVITPTPPSVTPPVTAPTVSTPPAKKSPLGMIVAIVGILVLIGLGWWFMQRKATEKTQSYTNSQFGYQVDFPANWQVVGGDPADVRLSDSAAANSIPESGVSIAVEDIGNRTLSDVALKIEPLLAGGELPEPLPDRIKIVELPFTGAQAIQATTIDCDANGFVDCGQTIRYILHNNQVYILDPLLADKVVADKIFDTFKFMN